MLLNKSMPVLLSHTQIYKIMLCPQIFSLTEAHSLQSRFIYEGLVTIFQQPVTVQTTIQYTQRVENLQLHFVVLASSLSFYIFAKNANN